MMIANASTSMLTRDEFENARALYRQIMRSRPTTGTSAAGPAKAGIKPVDDLLKELRGEGMPGLDSTLMAKLGELFTVLDGLQIELVAVDPSMHARADTAHPERTPLFKDPAIPTSLTSVTFSNPFMQVAVGKTLLTNIHGDNRLKSEFTDINPEKRGDRTLKLPGDAIDYQFNDLKASMPQDWSVLWATHMARTVRDGSDPDKVIAIPIVVRDAANKPAFYYWVGVQCKPDLIPEMLEKRWPTVDDWSAVGVR
jgi:hypothetical protein